MKLSRCAYSFLGPPHQVLWKSARVCLHYCAESQTVRQTNKQQRKHTVPSFGSGHHATQSCMFFCCKKPLTVIFTVNSFPLRGTQLRKSFHSRKEREKNNGCHTDACLNIFFERIFQRNFMPKQIKVHMSCQTASLFGWAPSVVFGAVSLFLKLSLNRSFHSWSFFVFASLLPPFSLLSPLPQPLKYPPPSLHPQTANMNTHMWNCSPRFHRPICETFLTPKHDRTHGEGKENMLYAGSKTGRTKSNGEDIHRGVEEGWVNCLFWLAGWWHSWSSVFLKPFQLFASCKILLLSTLIACLYKQFFF